MSSPDTLETLAAVLGQFAQEAGDTRMPETRERRVEREIAFGRVEVSGRDRANIGGFTLEKDQGGEYVNVRFGFREGSHYVSPPVLLRDRRAEMVAIAQKYATYFTARSANQTREDLQAQLAQSHTQLQETRELIPQADSHAQERHAQLEAGEAQLNREQGWSEAEKAARDALETQKVLLGQQMERLTPQFIDAESSRLANRVTTLESLFAQSPEVPVPDVGSAHPEDELYRVFTGLPGVVREVVTKERISGATENYLEIGGGDPHDLGQGVMEFSARHIKLPKPIPLGVATLVSVDNILTSALGTSLFGDVFNDESLRRTVAEQGGMYRVISYTSRTGRHQGMGTFIVWPTEPAGGNV